MSAVSGSGGARWHRWAAGVVAAFPMAGTDWDAHSDAVEAGLYSVRDYAQKGSPIPESVEEPPIEGLF